MGQLASRSCHAAQSCCCEPHKVDPDYVVPREGGLTQEQRNRVRPLLWDLDADFKEFAGEDGLLDAAELSAIWTKCAANKVGYLTQDDLQLIEHTAARYLTVIDIDGNGKVSYEEFVSYMLGAVEKRGPWKDLRAALQKSIQKDPRKLKALVDKFKIWDQDGDGFITMDEISRYLEQLAGQDAPEDMKRRSSKMAETFQQEFDVADVNGDNKLDPWEVLAFTLGRRKAPVELLLYDISGGLSKRFSRVLLGRKFEAIYHASLMAFGSEYWYGGRVFKSIPPCDKIFGSPLTRSITKLEASEYRPEIMVIRLGYTLVTMKEFDRYAHAILSAKYTHDNYDVLTHNCINFADEAAEYLTGMHLPDVVRHLADNVLAAPTAKMCRPFLNRWLGGFGQKGDHQGLQDSGESSVEAPDVERVLSEVLGQGKLVNYASEPGDKSPLMAVVTEDKGDGYGIRFFDPHAGEFRTADNVNKSHISAWRS